MRILLSTLAVLMILGLTMTVFARKGGPPPTGLVEDAIARLKAKDRFGSIRSKYNQENDAAYLGELLIVAADLVDWIDEAERRPTSSRPDTAAFAAVRADMRRLDSLLVGLDQNVAAATAREAQALHDRLYAELNPKIEDLRSNTRSDSSAFAGIYQYLAEVRQTFAADSAPWVQPRESGLQLRRLAAGVGVVVVSAVLFAITRAQ